MNVMSNADQQIDEMSRLAVAAREALTDQMVERMAVTGGNALELLDRLNDESTSAAVHHLIDRLTEMHKIGALDTACDMVMMMHAMRAAVTDQMVERLFSFAEHMVSSVATEDVANLVSGACEALNEAAAESSKAPARGGLMATVALMSKPETQRSLQFLLSFVHKLQHGHLNGRAGLTG